MYIMYCYHCVVNKDLYIVTEVVCPPLSRYCDANVRNLRFSPLYPPQSRLNPSQGVLACDLCL